ncbi:hypothetical protein BDV95DRAFT_628251 [Massariosphaeria phaeospora]|uniref:Helicase C-terminal domain-containing protein n=1 Tax=Massariosphaeria phaeospora TaxID=100035 RepID=A0A7C8I9I0_9PLEO|nr:hypothetical protein BDV95DRAFT_628251 [Massariosphaeria phaeospora]
MQAPNLKRSRLEEREGLNALPFGKSWLQKEKDLGTAIQSLKSVSAYSYRDEALTATPDSHVQSDTFLHNGSSAIQSRRPKPDSHGDEAFGSLGSSQQVTGSQPSGGSFNKAVCFGEKSKVSLSFSIVVYGPNDLFEHIGDFLQDHQLYLQDPIECDYNVRYRNPHLLSAFDDEFQWTSDLKSSVDEYEEVGDVPSLLDGLHTEELLPETETPHNIVTPLFSSSNASHQMQGLSFMKRRELGWFMHSPDKDVWSSHKTHNRNSVYVNNITNEASDEPPQVFRGGILADDMGLGKTLTTIALIASDLNEAHTIRNQNTLTAKAVFGLRAHRRWAVTGTPLHNRLSDFSSLLQYLQVYPFSNRKVFEDAIVKVWKQGDETLALERLRRLFKSITIRRLRSSIELTPRTDLQRVVHFSTSELNAYREIEAPIAHSLDLALARGHQEPGTYMNALVKINALRKFCNLGEGQRDNTTTIGSDGTAGSHNEVQTIVDDLLGSGQALCMVCNTNLTDKMDDGESAKDIYLTRCIRVICGNCYLRKGWTTTTSTGICSDHAECSISKASTVPPTDTDLELSTKPNPISSSKITALRDDLLRTPHEKSVIFSSWTTTLTTIRTMLLSAAIPHTLITGSVPPKTRAAHIHAFQTDPSIQVLILTISCGAEGLNLTAASRVYLMEPQWNPNMEEQILSRVHRLGQRNPVTTLRFVVQDSIEDHVINVQDRKKHLADLLLAQDRGGAGKGGTAKLRCLRDLLG